MRRVPLLSLLVLTATLLASPFAHAGPGDDHGEASASPGGPALPRFHATSERFELVGVIQGRQVTLYLDRSGSNEPVADARIELQMGDARLTAEKHEDAFEVALPSLPPPGVSTVTAVVTVGSETERLVGEVDIHEEVPASEAHGAGWTRLAGWAGGGLAVALGALLLGRRWTASRATRTGEPA